MVQRGVVAYGVGEIVAEDEGCFFLVERDGFELVILRTGLDGGVEEIAVVDDKFIDVDGRIGVQDEIGRMCCEPETIGGGCGVEIVERKEVVVEGEDATVQKEDDGLVGFVLKLNA